MLNSKKENGKNMKILLEHMFGACAPTRVKKDMDL